MCMTALHLLLLCPGALSLPTRYPPKPPAGVKGLYWDRTSLKQRIHYEVAEPPRGPSDSAPVLLLNGFGVGSFTWHRNMAALAASTGASVYAMDYVGQGASWPVDCDDGNAESEQGLRYAIDDWKAQAAEFIDAIVLRGASPDACVHLVGNSAGGLLAALLAAEPGSRVASLCLLNATPVWGSNLPGWDGRLPGPAVPRAIGRYLYDRMRDRANIAEMLEQVYAAPEQAEPLVEQIRAVTDASEGGHAAFASILWSPPATLPGGAGGFEALLQLCGCDALLLYGADDPWCSPPFGRAAARALKRRACAGERRTELVLLSPAGHCPHHEAPEAANAILSRWVKGQPPLASADATTEAFGRVSAQRAQSVGELEPQTPWERLLTGMLS